MEDKSGDDESDDQKSACRVPTSVCCPMSGLQRTELIISNLLQDNNTQAGDITGGHRTDLVVVTLTVEFSHSH